MRIRRLGAVATALFASAALLAIACGPTAEPTATTGAKPTATTAPQPPTATTAQQATATRPAATATSQPAGTTGPVATATVGAKDRGAIQPVTVLKSPGPNPLAQKGGTLRQLTTNYPPDWAMWEGVNGATTSFTTQLHDSLLDWNVFDGKDPDVLMANIAYDWWLSQDGQRWTFKLVSGAKFHDGSTFTCKDAKFTIDVGRTGRDDKGSELRSAPRAGWIRRVTTVTCVDDTTLQIETNGPQPSLPSALASVNFSPYPKAVFEGHLDMMVKEPGIGMGPFTVDQRVAGEKVTYKRFPNYWNKPYPYLDAMDVTNAGSATAVYAAFRVGRAELGSIPTGNLQNEIDRKFFTFVPGSRHQATFFETNNLRQPFGDPRVRMAMRCAIDSDAWGKTVSNGFADASMGIFPESSKWALPLDRQRAVSKCFDNRVPVAERVAIGQDLMKQLGYGPDKLLKADMNMYSNTGYEPLIPYLAQVYVDVKPNYTPTLQAYAKANAGEFDINFFGLVTPRQDADFWLYEHFLSTSDRNYGKWRNSEVDALLDQQSKTVDPAKRLEIVFKIQETLLKENAKILVQHNKSITGYAPWLKDYYIASVGIAGTHNKFTRLWIDQAELKAKGG